MGKPDVIKWRSDKAPVAGKQGVINEQGIAAPPVNIKEGDGTLYRPKKDESGKFL